MPTNLQVSKIISNFAVEFGSDAKFGHTKRSFCSIPKCQSLETFTIAGRATMTAALVYLLIYVGLAYISDTRRGALFLVYC